jgi:hypothetical protein
MSNIIEVAQEETNVTNDVLEGETFSELDNRISELSKRFEEGQIELYSKKYPLAFSKEGVPQEKYGDYSNITTYLNALRTFIQKDIEWGGQDFLILQSLYQEIVEVSEDVKKNKSKEVRLSSRALNIFYTLTMSTRGKGIADANRREYLLKPFNNALSVYEEEYLKLKDIETELMDLYVQKTQSEQQYQNVQEVPSQDVQINS